MYVLSKLQRLEFFWTRKIWSHSWTITWVIWIFLWSQILLSDQKWEIKAQGGKTQIWFFRCGHRNRILAFHQTLSSWAAEPWDGPELIWPLMRSLPVPSREICLVQLYLIPMIHAAPESLTNSGSAVKRIRKSTREVLLPFLDEPLMTRPEARSLLPSLCQMWVSRLDGLALLPVLT